MLHHPLLIGIHGRVTGIKEPPQAAMQTIWFRSVPVTYRVGLCRNDGF